ncbi:Dehydrogenase-like protein [Prochlorococcus marinus str. MIT 9215]|uniref:Dehydrogenase-like protein n=1 Tax=Prochlorococcus marinus (strain MIT 9215) TaxID=93060 RepID=A8G649_PROM2|nr:Gfo/Idh/MocA family oxidoreductase [Prochlorococcus marinus]ABV51080.1 Dehydrogenase-like protein [Prochlorococcus marinus str. MIT 9215]
MRVKIFGAGSIGNHLSNAARSLGWEVDICDISNDALERTKNLIYPSRYKKWDEKIGLYLNHEAPKGIYDLIFIGTPPKFHIPLAIEALKENPQGILIEKPLCTPDLNGADDLVAFSEDKNIPVYVGYDHTLAESTQLFLSKCISNEDIVWETLDVQFREHWGGIFNAHPWLNGPGDSYLGYSELGGGSTCEHSHALNLWQYFSQVLGKGQIVEVQAMMDFFVEDKVKYDKCAFFNLKTEKNFTGRVVQDVITKPSSKKARIQSGDAYLEWLCSYKENSDLVTNNINSEMEEIVFKKSRPEDFIVELKHIQNNLNYKEISPISLRNGLNTMLVIGAGFLSNKIKKNVFIDYSVGYNYKAFSY